MDALIKLGVSGVTDPVNFLEGMISCGISPFDHGAIRYLPIGDGDMFDWQSSESVTEVKEVVSRKGRLGESIGLSFLLEGGAGGQVILDQKLSEIHFYLTIELRLLDSCFVDFSYYVRWIAQLLDRCSIQVSSLICEQY